MFSAIAGAAGGALGGEAMAPLNEASDKLSEMEDSLSAPQDQLSKLIESVGTGPPSEQLEAAKKLLMDFTGGISSALEGDASKLLPPGVGCIASMWLKSIKKKLTAFKTEVDKLMGEASETPNNVKKELDGMKAEIESTKQSITGIESVIEDSTNSIKSSISDMEQMKNLGKTIEQLEEKFKDTLASARASVDKVTGALASTPDTVVSMLEELINTIDRFKMKAPKQVVSCFKPPACCCCLASGGVSEAQETLENAMATVAESLSLEPVLEALKKIKSSLKDFDPSPVIAVLDQVQTNFGNVLEPVKGAAGKISEMAGSVPGM
mmetsp:Transcript_27859/g.54799  ORF Transcript_27859/g.54799 Transcript_27859/m.54799 type:complete len:323 (+) Transcript_27859:73-1041(+)